MFDPFSWTIGENTSKCTPFHTNTDLCDRGLKLGPGPAQTDRHVATHLFISAILMLDQYGGLYLLLLLMASCL